MSNDYKKELEITLASLVAEYENTQDKTKEAGFAFELKRKNLIEEINSEEPTVEIGLDEVREYVKKQIDISEKLIDKELRNILNI
jgi:hypothetical protein